MQARHRYLSQKQRHLQSGPNNTASLLSFPCTVRGKIYWNYRDLEPRESAPLSRRLARASGYKAVKLGGSDAGYKDWFIHQFRKPGFTVEVGLGVNPLPVEQFDDICVEVGLLLAELLSDGETGNEALS
jgi:g-D-glutamyl-meso-diaminopimelate peptidase